MNNLILLSFRLSYLYFFIIIFIFTFRSSVLSSTISSYSNSYKLSSFPLHSQSIFPSSSSSSLNSCTYYINSLTGIDYYDSIHHNGTIIDQSFYTTSFTINIAIQSIINNTNSIMNQYNNNTNNNNETIQLNPDIEISICYIIDENIPNYYEDEIIHINCNYDLLTLYKINWIFQSVDSNGNNIYSWEQFPYIHNNNNHNNNNNDNIIDNFPTNLQLLFSFRSCYSIQFQYLLFTNYSNIQLFNITNVYFSNINITNLISSSTDFTAFSSTTAFITSYIDPKYYRSFHPSNYYFNYINFNNNYNATLFYNIDNNEIRGILCNNFIFNNSIISNNIIFNKFISLICNNIHIESTIVEHNILYDSPIFFINNELPSYVQHSIITIYNCTFSTNNQTSTSLLYSPVPIPPHYHRYDRHRSLIFINTDQVLYIQLLNSTFSNNNALISSSLFYTLYTFGPTSGISLNMTIDNNQFISNYITNMYDYGEFTSLIHSVCIFCQYSNIYMNNNYIQQNYLHSIFALAGYSNYYVNNNQILYNTLYSLHNNDNNYDNYDPKLLLLTGIIYINQNKFQCNLGEFIQQYYNVTMNYTDNSTIINPYNRSEFIYSSALYPMPGIVKQSIDNNFYSLDCPISCINGSGTDNILQSKCEYCLYGQYNNSNENGTFSSCIIPPKSLLLFTDNSNNSKCNKLFLFIFNIVIFVFIIDFYSHSLLILIFYL